MKSGEFTKLHRKSGVWGRFDPYFIPPGAEGFRRDNPKADVKLLDAGHFALETHVEEVAEEMRRFLAASLKP